MCRRIILSTKRHLWCLVDSEDYDWVMQWNWNYAWHVNSPWKLYAKRNVGPYRTPLYLHRALMLRTPSRKNVPMVVDHFNGQSLDNRRQNLRWASYSENSLNRVPRSRVPKMRDIERGCIASVDVPF